MTASTTIPKELPQDTALSYDFLRKEGIKLIQQLSRNTWTDHNIHDPGITILEQLCYAMSDLAYRIDYDIKDLLGSNSTGSYNDLYSPATILTVHPVTLLDLRKIVMDVEGVKNAWVEKVAQTEVIDNIQGNKQENIVPRGLYRVFIEKDTLFEISGSTILTNVKARLQDCRGVCEDFEEIKLLDTQPIRLQGTIEIADTIDDVNQLVTNVLHRVVTHLSPYIPFYTLQQLLEKGKRTDEIFDGPTLEHGFIDDKELLEHNRKKELQTSDIIREIMDEAGVLTIDKLSVATGTNTIKSWVLPLDQAKTPALDVEGTLEKLSFTSQGLTVNIDVDLVKTLYNQKRKEGLSRKLPQKERDIIMPETADRNIENYYSIQNQFPSNYGIGKIGLPDSATETRKAQAKQLTSYLVFFEQLLANYFSQIANFRKLMSFDDQDTRTYFNQSLLHSVPGLEEVLESKESYEEYLKEMTTDSAAGLQRKNRFLNHLLARFGEKFTGYGMLLQDISGDPYATDKKLIKDKATFLREYPLLSGGRGKAYNYEQSCWHNNNISGLEKRIARKLGVEAYAHRNLGDGDTEGFHMVEHILLRPRATYPYPFNTQYSAGKITRFEAAENTANTRCVIGSHTLKEGEEVHILENENYEEIYTVIATGEDYFEIEVPFQESATVGFWQRIPDIRYFIKTLSVEAFLEAPSQSGHTFCKVDTDNLKVGEHVEITQTQHYNGIHQVVAVTNEGFEIPVPFNKGETSGRWMPLAAPEDPYALQLTFVFPKWIKRYQNTEFKKFVEHTIREETPAHLTVYIKWLDKKEMQNFDKAFYTFLDSITKP